jgi:hypothetical protein
MSDAALHPLVEEADDTPGDPAVRGVVQEVVRGFSRALRTHLLYEGHSPALDRFVETLRERMGSLWEHLRHLNVQVEEREILWRGEPVYVGEERDNLAFLLFRDGVRELSFLPGFEEADLDGFLALLARIHRIQIDEEDLLTLLWEHEWKHFRYRYVEALSEGVHLPEASPASTLPAPAQPREEPVVRQTASTEDFREALYFLDEGEMRRVEAEVRREMTRDLWTGVLDGLLDRLEDSPTERQTRIVVIFGDVLASLLGAGRIDRAAYLLEQLVGIATSAKRPPPMVLREIRALFDQLARPETVAELVRTVEEAGETIGQEALGALLAYFPPESLGPLLRAGEATALPAARESILAAAERLAAPNPAALKGFIADPDAAVAGGAARLAGRLRLTDSAPELARLLRRPEPTVRLAAVEALRELRSATASGLVEGALEDADRDVRIAAVRAVAALRWAPARARLEAALEGKRLREADLTERIAFFESFGTLAGPDSVALLDRVLNGKSWLGRRENAEIRACAALGLGQVRHPTAEQALGTAAADADPVVRSAVGRALRTLRQ